jgi:hypothetical protein
VKRFHVVPLHGGSTFSVRDTQAPDIEAPGEVGEFAARTAADRYCAKLNAKATRKDKEDQ